ncbi:uncharacterized protein LOC135216301 [Macrobrachium nipponense]|uniref:uncharacterized protein LOC135216301 n=1 Tax=Macrobrachium nipponense TaxID=159736 RepID=UPI0030C849D8
MGFSGKSKNRNWFRCSHTPENGPPTVPLITVGIIGLTCYITAMFFSLKNGFRIADVGDHLAAYGTVVLLLVDFAYIFYTLKIIFCIKSNTFPTWPEVRDLRDTIMRLSSSFIVGVSLILVAYDWFTEFGHIKETGVSILEMTEGALRNLTDLVTSNSTLDENSDKFRLDQFRPADGITIPVSSSNATIEGEALSNKTLNEYMNSKEDHRSYTRDNPPFVSLFFSSFSFCIAGATIIIAAIFEKRSADALEMVKLCLSDYPFSEETELLLPASSRRWVPSRGVRVKDNSTATCGHGPRSRHYFETTEAAGVMSEDESNMASTSSPRLCYQEQAQFSPYDSEGNSAVARRVRFCEQSGPTNLYPYYGSGTRHYWCSVCNSTLAPSSPKLENSATKVTRKSSGIDLEENGIGIGQAISNAKASRESFPVDVVVHAEGSRPPVCQKPAAELCLEPAATGTAKMVRPQGTLPRNDLVFQASHQHRATELFQSADPVHKGDFIEMTEI